MVIFPGKLSVENRMKKIKTGASLPLVLYATVKKIYVQHIFHA